MSDVLVVYYSRTGKTRMVAEKLASLLAADIEEITEKKDRSGAMGFLAAGKDTMLSRPAELTRVPDPGQRRTVVVGMPVWAWRPPPAIRAYLRKVDLTGKTVCAFCTSDGSKGKGTFRKLNALLPAPLAETFSCVKPKADDAELAQALAAWAEKIQALGTRAQP